MGQHVHTTISEADDVSLLSALSQLKQHSTAQHSTAQHSTAQHSTAHLTGTHSRRQTRHKLFVPGLGET